MKTKLMFSLKQKELKEWGLKNFDSWTASQMLLGMSEELGMASHYCLKGIQNPDNWHPENIAHEICDCMIFAVQALTALGYDAEKLYTETINEVLKRDKARALWHDGLQEIP